MNDSNKTIAPPSPQPARRRWIIAGGVVGAIAMLAGAAWWWSEGRFIESTDNAYVRADVVSISPRVAGNVVEVPVADNQLVQAGEVLARIDDRDYRARVQEAEGAAAAARAEITRREAAVAELRAQQAQQGDVIAQGEAQERAGAADARRAGLEYQRQQLLSQEQVSSARQFESAEAEARHSEEALGSARAELAARRHRLAVLTEQSRGAAAALEQARAALQQAQARLALARIDLDDTVIRAPQAGMVGQRALRVGQYAEVGGPLLALVPRTVYVVANFKETQFGRIAPGQPVRLRVDAFDGAVLSGRVDSFSPGSGAQFALLPPDNATGNFTKIVQRMPLRISLNPGQDLLARLRPGMSVVARIDTRGHGDGGGIDER